MPPIKSKLVVNCLCDEFEMKRAIKWRRMWRKIKNLSLPCLVFTIVIITKLMTSQKHSRLPLNPADKIQKDLVVGKREIFLAPNFKGLWLNASNFEKFGPNPLSVLLEEGTEINRRKRTGIEPPHHASVMWDEYFATTPPNPNFVFHNKLPKSGSSTMNNILKVLRKKNDFNFLKVEPGVTTFYDRRPLVTFLQGRVQSPYLLLKHHYWVNFTEYKMTQPTYINVIRDPIEWFTSRFYFARYGWERKPGCRVEYCGMSKEDFNMDIDECVAKRHRDCVTPWMYLPFFCGASEDCINALNEEQKNKALEIAKKRIVEDYYVVGILEQFEDTLRLLELLLPRYFRGALGVWRGGFVQRMRNLTRTVYKKKMSSASEDFFRNGPLKHEVALYDFARKRFNRQLKVLNLKPFGSDKIFTT